MQRHNGTPAAAPMTGANKYTHKCSKWPLTRAGASDRAGFIDAPDTGPANRASNPMTDPTAMPAVIPFSFAPVETHRTTSIRISVRITSRAND